MRVNRRAQKREGEKNVIKAVLFDMDGVLAFTEGFYNRRRIRFLQEHGFPVDPDFDGTGSNDGEIWERLVPGDAALRERLHREYRAYSDAHPTPWAEVANPQARPVFSALKGGGLMVAICSSSYRSLIEEFVDQVGVRELVDFIISGDECSAYKPDPDIYLRAMDVLGIVPHEALVVEDSPLGIEAGVASGALTCALVPPAGVELDQSRAHLRVQRLVDVVDLAQTSALHYIA